MKPKVSFLVSRLSKYGGFETTITTILPLLKEYCDCSVISAGTVPDDVARRFCEAEIPFIEIPAAPKAKLPHLTDWLRYRTSKYITEPREAFNLLSRCDTAVDFCNFRGRRVMSRLRRSGVRTVGWFHDGRKNMVKHEYFSWSRYDRIVVLTDSLRDDMKHRHPRLADRFTAVPNIIDADRIRSMAEEPVDLPERYFVHVSRLCAGKDLNTVIDAFDLFVRRTKSDAKLVIVGNGELEDAFRARAASQSCSEKIIFAGRKSNPFPYMKHALGCILSSETEGFAMVLAEALACAEGIVTSSDCLNGLRISS